ncbi:serine protease [Pseudorhodoplanes sinuspersici]|uniref:Uncharacterized protein n=1 Tax=Pseudorhodoplanes sinuspersici TaxID=1235591 RepID=A0A1W6ZP91_9HYPH|nr:serine protease [Pseudorhodoplanes sinuspersici]ARP99216.1 hypothetical protein CAK95_09050 [Pseudorhodoplanes sinuspersici]RKE69118.1 putative peptidoglycan binding protein [Pseudorhodoplanes sinuspersici]
MRFAAWTTVIALAFISQAMGQNTAPKAEQKQQPAARPEAAPVPPAKPAAKKKAPQKAAKKSEKSGNSEQPPAPAMTPNQREAYTAMPVAERLAIQSDLIWSGDLAGAADPAFGDRAIAAVRAFQHRNKFEETGIITPDQRQALATATRNRKDHIGWRLVEDDATPGVRLGIPSKLVPRSELGATGTRWSSARGEIQIETFREKMAGATLNELFEDLKKKPTSRRVEFTSVQGNTFLISGLQGLKKFHVRVFMKDNEARGLTILYDQAMEGIVLPMVDIMANAFIPFGDAATASATRKVQYGSGIVVTQSGHVVTDRQLAGDCQTIVIAGLGRADRLADDKTTDLTLLQVNGADHLKSLRFSSDAPKSTDLTLLGIAAPETQAGARDVTSANAKLRGVDGSRVLMDARPIRGFVGGGAFDGQGQFVGMIAAANQPSFIPTSSIRKFLDGAGVYPAIGKSDIAAAKNAIVRVVCVRK